MRTLVIIGAGPGGYGCAVRAAQSGLDVHVVDRADHLGGTCLSEGCIPTKCLCHTAEQLLQADALRNLGFSVEGTFNLSAAIDRKDGVITQLRSGIASLLKMPGITLHNGRARFAEGDAHTVIVGEERIKADHVIIATGSVSKFLPIPGAHTPGVLTSTELLQLRRVPQSLCVIGGGVVGLEFAGIFNAFGSKVTVIEYAKDILPNFDSDISKRLRLALKKQGISFVTAAPVTSIERTGDNVLKVSYEQKGVTQECLAECVLMAAGRGANLESLNFAEAGIATGRRGVEVDDNMQTNVPGVYAVGDINACCMLAHAATHQSFRALDHILGRPSATDLSLVPSAVFTNPEVAMVGMTEDAAKADGRSYAVGKAYYRTNGRALSMEAANDGYVKIIADADGHLLGAHIMGANASELIHELTLVMSMGGTVETISHTIHAHPTLSELVWQAGSAAVPLGLQAKK